MILKEESNESSEGNRSEKHKDEDSGPDIEVEHINYSHILNGLTTTNDDDPSHSTPQKRQPSGRVSQAKTKSVLTQ